MGGLAGPSILRRRPALSPTCVKSQTLSRPETLGELEVSVAPRVLIDETTDQQFAELGVHRLVLILPRDADAPALERFIGTVGDTLGGQV